MDADELHDRLEGRLMSHGVYVTSLDRTESALRITYETATPGEGVPQREIGRVLNLLLDSVAEGWEPSDVRGRVEDIDGDDRGTWRAESEWLRAHARGDISDVDLSQRVLDTVEDA